MLCGLLGFKTIGIQNYVDYLDVKNVSTVLMQPGDQKSGEVNCELADVNIITYTYTILDHSIVWKTRPEVAPHLGTAYLRRDNYARFMIQPVDRYLTHCDI